MKTFGNILWFIFGGLEWAIALVLEALCCFVSLIGIPVGIQLFKMAGFVIWPFGKQVQEVNINGFKKFCNVLWAITGGWISAALFGLCGIIFFVTIIGIPFGKQYFKLAKFIILPLGKGFVKE